jgi:hypothetical protein
MKTIIALALACGVYFHAGAQVSFTLESSITVGGAPRGIAAADVNGDGWIDVITVSGSDNTLSVMTNDGHGDFVLSSSPAVGENSNPVLAVDVNGDGKVDLVSASYSLSSLSVLTNNGSGDFATSSSPGSSPFSVVVADVNRDGSPDLFSADNGAAPSLR